MLQNSQWHVKLAFAIGLAGSVSVAAPTPHDAAAFDCANCYTDYGVPNHHFHMDEGCNVSLLENALSLPTEARSEPEEGSENRGNESGTVVTLVPAFEFAGCRVNAHAGTQEGPCHNSGHDHTQCTIIGGDGEREVLRLVEKANPTALARFLGHNEKGARLVAERRVIEIVACNGAVAKSIALTKSLAAALDQD